MPAKSDPQASVKLLSNLFARFTADRDLLLAAVERCERRLGELAARLDDAATTRDATAADRALALATEALETARTALAAAHKRR